MVRLYWCSNFHQWIKICLRSFATATTFWSIFKRNVLLNSEAAVAAIVTELQSFSIRRTEIEYDMRYIFCKSRKINAATFYVNVETMENYVTDDVHFIIFVSMLLYIVWIRFSHIYSLHFNFIEFFWTMAISYIHFQTIDWCVFRNLFQRVSICWIRNTDGSHRGHAG